MDSGIFLPQICPKNLGSVLVTPRWPPLQSNDLKTTRIDIGVDVCQARTEQRPFLADLVNQSGLALDPILSTETVAFEQDGETLYEFKYLETDLCGVACNSFIASASVVEHMREKHVFSALRSVQTKFRTCMVELFLGYFASRELGCSACAVSLDHQVNEFARVQDRHLVCEEAGFPRNKHFGKYYGSPVEERGEPGSFKPCPPSWFSQTMGATAPGETSVSNTTFASPLIRP